MTYEKLKYWVALKSIPGIGNVLFQLLIDRFGSIEKIFSASAHELQTIPGLSKKSVSAIVSYKGWGKIKNALELSSKAGIKIITYQDDLYPAKLLNVYDRPPFLYYKGSLNKADVNIAIVGSRLASTYGKYTTEKISRELALKGITIVSGLARGIDSTAHRGALAAQGRTIAILGSGLDIIYPPENKNLYANIIQNGAVISEFPLATKPCSYNFPARNRIISGMSYGVVVVEAGEKSGSLITARLALEQGREVFAVPGSIDSAGSRGTNKLIKQGAKLIENTDDILEEIWPQIERTVSFSGADVAYPESPKNKKYIDKENLSPLEKCIIGFLSGKRIHVDELISVTGLSTGDLMSSLMSLELRGIIEQHPGKLFSLK
jgi:DNA processing protein